MSKQSAGVLMFRRTGAGLEVMLVHPGGPFWVNKDEGAWSIPKGLFETDEEPLDAAMREFREETGFDAAGDFISLGTLKQPSKKTVHAFAVEGDIDVSEIVSNTFELEWPPHSGKFHQVPEVDRGDWFDIETARQKISKGQLPFLDRLIDKLAGPVSQGC